MAMVHGGGAATHTQAAAEAAAEQGIRYPLRRESLASANLPVAVRHQPAAASCAAPPGRYGGRCLYLQLQRMPIVCSTYQAQAQAQTQAQAQARAQASC